MKGQLLSILKASKTDPSLATASSNAATILNAKKFCFSELDLSGVQIPGADLSGAVLDKVNFSKADLSSVNFKNVSFKDANLSYSCMENVKFGERPYIEAQDFHLKNICFSPDGKILACSGMLWEVNSGKFISNFKNVSGYICFSPDGSILANDCHIDNVHTIRLVEVSSGKLISTFESPLYGNSFSYASSISFSPDGSLLAAVFWDIMLLWEVFSGKLIYSIKPGGKDICFSPDGRILAIGSHDNTISLWEVASGKPIYALEGHTSLVSSVCFNYDGSILASGSYDKTIRLWEVASGKLILSLKDHCSAINTICFSPDGSILASGGGEYGRGDTIIRLWEVASGKIISKMDGHSRSIKSLCFNYDGSLLASGGSDSSRKGDEILLWNIADALSLNVWNFKKNTLTCATKSQLFCNGANLKGAIGLSESQCRLLQQRGASSAGLEIYKNKMELLPSSSINYSICFSDDGSLLAWGGKLLWEVRTGKIILIIDTQNAEIDNAFINHNGSLLATRNIDKTICIYDLANGRIISTFEGHSCLFKDIHFSLDGSLSISRCYDNTVRIWEVTSGKIISVLERKYHLYDDFCLSPDNTILACGKMGDPSIHICDVNTGKSIAVILEIENENSWLAENYLDGMCFSPDGSIFAYNINKNGDNWYSVCLTMVPGYREINEITNGDRISGFCFNQDSSLLAIAGSNTINLWNVANGKYVNTFKVYNGSIITPDTKQFP